MPSPLFPSVRPPRVAVVFGSGGARGLAHLGVMEALEKLGLVPGIFVGTSIGSIAAAACATGSLGTLRSAFLSMGTLEISRMFLEPGIPGSGLIEGRHIMDHLRSWIPDVTIEGLHTTFAAVAMDIETCAEKVFTSGSILDAVRASISIPGIFTPCRCDAAWLVDGALVNPLPVSVARSLGAERVLAVDINLTNGDAKAVLAADSPLSRVLRAVTRGAPTLIEVVLQTIRIGENAIERERLQRDPPDLLLSPPVGQVLSLDFRNPEATIEAGRACAMAHADELRALFHNLP